MSDPTVNRYLNGDYATKNPDWDVADAPWKAKKVREILQDHSCDFSSLVEVGCGSGSVLLSLRATYPHVSMAGFDIAPAAQHFWFNHSNDGIRFVLGDYLALNEKTPDIVLVLDVLEHLGNPWDFLTQLSSRSKLVVFHIPLDLSSLSVLREKPLLHVRDKVGHLHYFTRGLALALLEESGFEVIDARYTGAAFSAPQRSLMTRFVSVLRRFFYAANRDLGARLLGGETLMVLARSTKGKYENCHSGN